MEDRKGMQRSGEGKDHKIRKRHKRESRFQEAKKGCGKRIMNDDETEEEQMKIRA